MAEATEPCTASECANCPRLPECAERWSCEEENPGRGIRIALLVSMALWGGGYWLVTAVLRGCQ